ncbi:hypothetical protein [Clostridium omnivorum]|uniref:DUF4129 domain-containing protein n=1 Tax=Clostridium omnivorum TaxID=1604902 RepID=A0ABQ5N383_9CLOT|nr:hypothetical protein [Clostridium sp. E14]GLC29677.1 hypothetical protein bsdE14_10870 [Clostridium sp. E14]
MSWYRQVKTLFTLSLVLFLYILWAIIGNFLFDNVIDFRIFLLAAVVVYLMQYLNAKNSSRYIVVIVPAVTAAVATYFIKGNGFWLDFIALVLMTLLFYKIEDEDINYYVYRARIKQMIYIMIALGIVIPMLNMELSKSILRFYIIFLMSTVLVQREARAYSYKLHTRKRVASNIAIILAMMALSWEKVFRALIAFIKILYVPINYVLEKIIFVLAFLIVRPLEGFVEYLRKLIEEMFKKRAGNVDGALVQTGKDPILINNEGGNFPAWLNPAIKVIILLVIIYIIFKLFQKQRLNADRAETELQSREKIERLKTRERKISSIIKDLFRSADNRTKVLNIFRKFEKVTFEKEIFKEHMTATQLTNVTKAFTDLKAVEGGVKAGSHPLDEMKNIYNEAKFSDHDIEADKATEIKEKYEKVKRNIKKD